jgi:GT2 family glycosyltransferase
MQQGMTPDVSILIVNFNSGAVLPACLRSLRQWTDAKRTEVLIIDNASTDGSVARISKEFPEVHWILSDSNLGFGRANNIGATHARGRYLFLLNPDTELRGPVTGLLMALLDRAENADVGCAGAAVVDECGREGVAAGNFPTPVTLLKELFPSRVFPHRLRAQARADGLLEVDYVSGADLFIPRRVFDASGGFDPDFFLYFEETELQYRMARMGYRRVICPGVNLMHLCGTPDHKVSSRKIELFESSRLLFHKKCYGRLGGLWARCWLVLFYGSRWLFGGPRHLATGIRIALRGPTPQ